MTLISFCPLASHSSAADPWLQSVCFGHSSAQFERRLVSIQPIASLCPSWRRSLIKWRRTPVAPAAAGSRKTTARESRPSAASRRGSQSARAAEVAKEAKVSPRREFRLAIGAQIAAANEEIEAQKQRMTTTIESSSEQSKSGQKRPKVDSAYRSSGAE